MHVVSLTARYPPDVLGGGEVSTQILAEALAALGEQVTVLCGAQEDADADVEGVHVLRRRTLLPWWGKPLNEELVSRATARAAFSILHSQLSAPPDVLHAHEFRSALTLSLLSHPARLATIRDYAPICGTTNNLWWDGSSCDGCSWPNVLFRCHRVVEASLLHKPFRVAQYKGNLSFRLRAFARLPVHIYTSETLRQRVASRLMLPLSVRSVVIPNALDPSWLAHPLAPLPQEPRLIAVGRLETTKGTDLLLEALAAVQQVDAGVHLTLVGGGELPRFQSLARRLGLEHAVTFAGAQPPSRVRDLIDESRVVVSAHRWEEPFGRLALEAGARGRPLVASNLGALRETTTAATGVLVSPPTPAVLADALVDLLRDEVRCRRLGEAARSHVAAHYSAQHIARQTHDLYHQMVSAHR